MAAMAWLPTVSVGVTNVACPLLSSEAVPRVVAPSVKATVPAGVPPLPFTVAAKVTGCPNVLGFGAEVSVMVVVIVDVEVEAEVTFCVSVALLPENESGVFWHIGGSDGMATSSERGCRERGPPVVERDIHP